VPCTRLGAPCERKGEHRGAGRSSHAFPPVGAIALADFATKLGCLSHGVLACTKAYASTTPACSTDTLIRTARGVLPPSLVSRKDTENPTPMLGRRGMRHSEGEITHQQRLHHALVGSDDEHISSQSSWARQARAFAKMNGTTCVGHSFRGSLVPVVCHQRM